MDIFEYQKQTNNTKSDKFYPPEEWKFLLGTQEISFVGTETPVDILHAIVGISTEAGELLNVPKKAMFYNTPVDLINLDEEIGDVLWYIGIYCNARGVTFEQLCGQNNAKLKKRFPNKFTEHDANNRDLEAERKILEENQK